MWNHESEDRYKPTVYVTSGSPSKIKFSEEEIRHLAIAFGVLTLAFTILFYRRYLISGIIDAGLFLIFFLVSAISVGTAFILHELAHKAVAQRYGCWAEFRAYPQGLMFALIFSFLGFIFAAPGAVYISGYITKEQNGKISALGPMMNILIALAVFPFVGFILIWGRIDPFLVVFSVNTWLAIFNLIPFPPLDGSKIFAWNLRIWIAMLAAAIALFTVMWM